MQPIRLKIAPRLLILGFDVGIGQLAYLFSCFLYFSMVGSEEVNWTKLLSGSLVMAIFSLLAWSLFRITRRIVRFSNQTDYLLLFAAAFLVNLFAWVTSKIFIGKIYGEVQLWIISFLFQALGLMLLRVLIRQLIILLQRNFTPRHRNRLLIYGSGELAQSLKKALEADAQFKYELVGFLEDDDKKVGKYIDGIKVYSASENLRDTIITQGVEEVFIAINKLNPDRKARFIEKLIVFDIKIKELPPLKNWYEDFSPDKLTSININDLLQRDPIHIYNEEVKSICHQNVMLVTGAAGSIGSEIVRKLAENGASSIICLDQAETPLHELRLELGEKHQEFNVEYVVADITDARRLQQVFERYRPDYVFHAAAYKHVPLMEENPYEALHTNVEGTRRLADMAVANGVSRFVMISSDKAVNPTNVMGATKRMAEAYVQALNASQDGTRFITTRFGNVLGSNGSVIPLFKQQIAKGGPVTVTHPDMVRYFMTIPEAGQLVLEAAAMGRGGEVFVFDMGKEVRITDLAKSMIRLAGFIPDRDIKIEYTGTRPGEKLFEELFSGKDDLIDTHHPMIMIGKVKQYEYDDINLRLTELLASRDAGGDLLREKIKGIIPEFVFEEVRRPQSADLARRSFSEGG